MSKHSLKTVLRQLERAADIYCETDSLYARQRAHELIAEMRAGLDDVDRLLSERAGLVGRYPRKREEGNMKDFTATIRPGSPREQDWLAVFGDNTIVLQSPIPHWASAPGIPAALFYKLDLAALTDEQRARLIAHLAKRFDAPEEEVARDLDQVGCPILDEDVTVTVYHPQKWF